MATDENILPWLRKGDELFMAGEDWWHNACLNYGADNWTLYAHGYKQAGDILANYLMSKRQEQDLLIFPIVFLYRQYLELRLKRLIRDGHLLLDDPPTFPKTHDLEKLWAECRSVLEAVEPVIPSGDLEAVDGAINQFCATDPNSQGFRYPTNKWDENVLPSDLRYINVRNLAEVINRISSFFEAATDMFMVYLDHKRDMDREYRDTFGHR